jgi:histidinol-phosphatase (PHP family)
MIANYHTHTKRCQHATGEDREYVEAAIEAGLRILGFADHCPWVYPDKNFVSGIRLAPHEVDGYFYSLESLKKEYEKDIKIYIGFETEHCPNMIPEQEELLKGYPLDYMICGQHFLDAEYVSFYAGRPHADEDFLKRYVDTAVAGINSGRYLYLAHPDLVNFTGDEEVYRSHMKRLCEALKEKDIPVEINILGLSTGRRYPGKRFLELAKETGNTAILGIDAHAPEQILNGEAIKKAELLCEEFGLPLVDGDLLQGVKEL